MTEDPSSLATFAPQNITEKRSEGQNTSWASIDNPQCLQWSKDPLYDNLKTAKLKQGS